MSEAPEVPEARDPFEKRVAVTIAIIVALIALIANRGDDKKTAAIIAATHSADQWAFFQAKSAKEHAYDIQARLLVGHADAAALHDEFAQAAKQYASEKEKLKADAEALDRQVARDLEVHETCDHAVLILQIAAVLCSLAILVRWHLLWGVGSVVALGGLLFGVVSFVERERAEARGEEASPPHVHPSALPAPPPAAPPGER